ncbi:putative spermidine/putrescine transport system permease protein [Actinocorallia herbida]|uniref:Putative spermidine/putrescine transport system permease protein n=1 Tax=Actinocorallia herbida TaxID=58109 RepID=A0A3N1D6G4_9ACTN|nr:putative spermidine/putrescine transport system permease protein [Actinocorallia herbida]
MTLPSVRRPRLRVADGSGLRWLLLPPIAVLALLLIGPVAMLAQTAFSGEENAFASLVGDQVFYDAVQHTIVMTVVVTVCAVGFGTLYALGISAAPRWVAGLLLAGLFLTMWTSVLVRTFGWMLLELPAGALFWALNELGLRDQPLEIYQTSLAAYPAMVHVMLPYAVLPVWIAIGRLDHAQIQAAQVFGARPLLVLRKVVLPQLRPAMISAAVLIFLMSLGFYVTPLMLGSPSELTVAGYIDQQFNGSDNPERAAAMSVLLLGAVLVLYTAADRLFRVSEKWG